MPMINLQSSDGELFETHIEIAKCSGTIKNMLDDCGIEAEGAIVPLPNVKAAILRRVLAWADHHKDDGKLVDSVDDKKKEAGEISEWDADFLKVDQGTLFELILAANYLDTKGLLDITCQTVANMIKGKQPEEIRKMFDIPNDFTPAEQESMKIENEWCDGGSDIGSHGAAAAQ